MDFSHFNIIWLESCTYPRETVVSLHKHKFFHFIYCISGSGNITIANKQYKFNPDHIYLMPPLTEHTFSNNEEQQLKTIEIKFSIENLEAEEFLKSLPFCFTAEKSPIKSILSTMYKEHSNKTYMSSAIVDLNFELLFVYLLRSGNSVNDGQMDEDIDKRRSPEIDKVVMYIYENLNEDLSLTNLSKISGFEKKYFSRKFKMIKKQSPVDFVRQTRIKKAKELLRYSDMNITQIAESTGFQSVHYFSNQFFKCTGMRPLNYKKSVK